MQKRRILISVNTSWNILNFRKGLIEGLVAAGYEVIAAAPQDEYSKQLEELGCRFAAVPMDNKGTSPANDLKLLFRYWKLMRAERPDAFLGFTVKPNIFGGLAARLLGVPVINNVSGLGTVFIHRNWVTIIVKRLYALALSRSKTVFFQNSDDLALFVREGLVRKEVTALLPGSGVNLRKFTPAPRNSAANDTPTVFLLVARLLWDKGIAEYVEAARLVKEQVPEARFQLLGFLDVENRTAVDRDSVDRWVEQGTIEYLGHAEDVRPHLAKADCVVLPSYREGMPRTLLEAAAMAKPLITTDVPGCRQIVENGENGFLCTVRDAESLAERMLEFNAVPAGRRAEMGRAARRKVEREFDEQFVVARYLEVLQ